MAEGCAAGLVVCGRALGAGRGVGEGTFCSYARPLITTLTPPSVYHLPGQARGHRHSGRLDFFRVPGDLLFLGLSRPHRQLLSGLLGRGRSHR